MHASKLQAFSQLLLLQPESIASDWGDEVHIPPMVWPAGWTQEETSERNDVARIFPMALSAKEQEEAVFRLPPNDVSEKVKRQDLPYSRTVFPHVQNRSIENRIGPRGRE